MVWLNLSGRGNNARRSTAVGRRTLDPWRRRNVLNLRAKPIVFVVKKNRKGQLFAIFCKAGCGNSRIIQNHPLDPFSVTAMTTWRTISCYGKPQTVMSPSSYWSCNEGFKLLCWRMVMVQLSFFIPSFYRATMTPRSVVSHSNGSYIV